MKTWQAVSVLSMAAISVLVLSGCGENGDGTREAQQSATAADGSSGSESGAAAWTPADVADAVAEHGWIIPEGSGSACSDNDESEYIDEWSHICAVRIDFGGEGCYQPFLVREADGRIEFAVFHKEDHVQVGGINPDADSGVEPPSCVG